MKISNTITTPDAATLHSQMPCCDVLSFVGSYTSPQLWVPAAVVTRPGTCDSLPRAQATLPTASTAPHEHTPPIFL